MSLPKGFLISGKHCGIKKKGLDLGLIYTKDYSQAFGVFTTNLNPSYSVTSCKKNINNPIKAVLVNSGNANCHSHKQGLKDTENIISKLAGSLKVKKSNILFCSTGIIGERLPKHKLVKGFPGLIKALGTKTKDFSQSILTTDTFAKVSQAKVSLGKKSATILGFAKGAGMIYPNMATMLGFILTDAGISKSDFKKISHQAIEESFNSISVDGCTSTNDTVLFLSSKRIALKTKKEIDLFSEKVKGVCLNLAKLIIKDAEGATKFVQITVNGAKTKSEAKKAGMALANSNLFKCALYGQSSNWGRIVSSLGQAGINLNEDILIKSTNLKKKNIKISLDLKRGKSSWTVYTSDLTPKYVKINAEYI